MGDKIQIRGDWDLLAQEAAQARNAGMTYGAWKARQFQKDQAEIARKEQQYQAYKLKKERERRERREQRRKAREAEGMQEPENGLKCVQCGAPLRGYQKRYCCQRCSYIYNAEKLKRDRIERYNRKSQAAPERFCPVCGERILGDIRRIYYNTKSRGGFSPCIQGKNSQGVPDSGCNVLPNCVGYAIGRFNEIGQWGCCKYFASDNAERFILHRDNLEMGQEPRIGACMVWQKGATLDGSDGAGHVAIVERVVNSQSVVTSESGYGCANPFWLQTRNKGSGNWGMGSAYKFLGFIYNPAPCCGGSTAQETGNPVDYKAKTTAALNVRKGPGLNYSIVAGLPFGQKVRIIRENGKWGQLENGNWCCLDYLKKTEEESSQVEISGDWEPKVGDIVQFRGGQHFVNAYAAAGTAARAGKARITTIFQPGKSRHPYHLVHIAGGGSNVYGWVDKGSFDKA